jgi:hypothetical protein
MMFAMSRRIERAARDHGQRLRKFWTDAADVQRRLADAERDGKLADDARAYERAPLVAVVPFAPEAVAETTREAEPPKPKGRAHEAAE